MSNLITCPKCHHEIAVNEVLQSQLSEQIRLDLEKELRSRESALVDAQKQIAEKEESIKAGLAELDSKVKAGIEAERTALLVEAKKQAAAELNVELQDRNAQVSELTRKLAASQNNELELRKQERELKAQKEELELKVAREIDSQREKIRESALKQAAEEHQLKDAEQRKVIGEMRRQIEDLKRKAEQGSVQTQGEVQELALEAMLEAAFPADSIDPVGKGVNGADCKQVVFCSGGTRCGYILWESKRTKTFSKSWLPKLRDDQRSSRSSVAVLVTQAMPEGVDTFALIDGVWVCSWQCAKGLAMALRAGLIEVSKNKLASEGRVEKMELVYNYLSSREFQRCVEGIVEAFVTMQTDLESEKRSAKRLWNKREKQIDRAIMNTASLYGDLQGIIGASMPVVEGLTLRCIESESSDMESAA